MVGVLGRQRNDREERLRHGVLADRDSCGEDGALHVDGPERATRATDHPQFAIERQRVTECGWDVDRTAVLRVEDGIERFPADLNWNPPECADALQCQDVLAVRLR